MSVLVGDAILGTNMGESDNAIESEGEGGKAWRSSEMLFERWSDMGVVSIAVLWAKVDLAYRRQDDR